MADSLIKKELLVPNEKITSQETIEAYLEALTFSNLAFEQQIHTRNVRIYKNDHVHQIYTNSHPKQNLPHIVMLHGFGGTALTYIRTFQHLKEHYQVHALDTFGVGLSSLGNYSEKFTDQEAKNYFVNAIQEWRKALQIQKITLVGHSFGGYIAALYSERYPQNVKRLILLSPAGTTTKTQQEIAAQIQKRRSASFSSKLFYCLAQKIYNINIRPSRVMGSCLLGNTFIEKITSGRLKLKDTEKQAWKKYLKAIAKKGDSSETGFYKLFEWPVNAKKSIEQIFSQNIYKFPVQFYYGTEDWMDKTGALRLSETNKNVLCETVTQAGHQIIFDNPLGVVQKILRKNRVDSQNERTTGRKSRLVQQQILERNSNFM